MTQSFCFCLKVHECALTQTTHFTTVLPILIFGKHFLRMCPCNLYNRPSTALPISQAWNVGRTTEARLQPRQIALYPLTCQHRRQMNSPSIINGIKEHLRWQWIAQSSSANMRNIKTVANVTTAAGVGFVERLIPVSHFLMCGLSTNELLWFLWLSWPPIWQRSDLSRLIEDSAI